MVDIEKDLIVMESQEVMGGEEENCEVMDGLEENSVSVISSQLSSTPSSKKTGRYII